MVRKVQGWYEKSMVRIVHGTKSPQMVRNVYGTKSLWYEKSGSLQISPLHLSGPFEQKPIKNFGGKGAWAYVGTAQIFWSTPY